MRACYEDIYERISADVFWWDENGVPRYGAFAPNRVANIYADECALLLIQCQACAREFEVAMSSGLQERALGDASLAEQIAKKIIHYGDPPNVDCCAAGPSMNCEDIRVLAYWHRGPDTNREWKRETSCEVSVDTRESVAND